MPDEKTERIIIVVLYLSLGITAAYTIMQNMADPWLIIMLSGILAVSLTLRNSLIYPSDKYNLFGKLSVLIDIIIIYIIGRIDNGGSFQIYYFIVMGDVAKAYSYSFSGAVTAACFVSFIASKYYGWGLMHLAGFIPDMAFHTLPFIALYAALYLVRYEILQKEKLRETMFALKVKSKQFENTCVRLKKASEELEEMTIVKERNKIAREIHDTMGHTLTTVLVEIEAGERLLRNDPELASEKLRLAKGQVRKGLNDIRESVKVLQSGREIKGLAPSLKLLIEETTKHGDIFIKYEISELPPLSEEQEIMFYRALQEGLTNSIRHGGSNALIFKLKHEKDHIEFFLQDNGRGCEIIMPGFGLMAMQERVREQGGIIRLDSAPGEGFTISITVPLACEAECANSISSEDKCICGKEEENETDKNNNSR